VGSLGTVWLLWAVTALQSALAVVGWLNEKDLGLRISKARLYSTGVCFLLMSVLVLLTVAPGSFSPLKPAVPQGAGPAHTPASGEIQQAKADVSRAKQTMDADQADFDHAQQILNDAQTSYNTALAQLQQLEPSQVIIVTSPRQPQGRLSSAVTGVVGIMVVLAGTVILLISGPIRTLLPSRLSMIGRSSSQAKAINDLLRMEAAVYHERYEECIRIADDIVEQHLNDIDNIDYLYLRGYCLLQAAGSNADDIRKSDRLRQAIRDLEAAVEAAPKRGDALYVLAIAYGQVDKAAQAIEMFDRAEPLLKDFNLPFEHNRSVSCLRAAEDCLGMGQNHEAEAFFKRVSSEQHKSIAGSRLKIGILSFRQAIGTGDTDRAREIIASLKELAGGSGDKDASVDILATSLDVRIALRDQRYDIALTQTDAFLDKHMPKDVPAPTDDAAEDIFPAIPSDLLPLGGRDVYRGFLFVRAVALAHTAAAARGSITELQVTKLAEPLLKALQIDPRHPEVLAALGGLYYWFRKPLRPTAVEWLEAALKQGVRGVWARQIVERDHLIEVERREALDWFRSSSARFLRDPSLAGDVRKALVAEIGRFQEFEPMLIDLASKPEFEPEEPTLAALQERGRYLARLVAHFEQRKDTARHKRLAEVQAAYSTAILTIESQSEQINKLEQSIFRELSYSLSDDAF
jgi:tetratricopeptide (TPR) repeat protein